MFGEDIKAQFMTELIRQPIRWIIFDAVGTLIRPNPSVSEAYFATAQRFGSRLSLSEIAERFSKSFRDSESRLFDSSSSYIASNDEIEIARWRWIVREVVPDANDSEACFRDLWDHFANPNSWICFDDVQQSLEELRKTGIKLGIASNFDSRLHSVCQDHPALRSISFRMVSSEAGFRKPAALFYEQLIERCQTPAEQVLMIGDDPIHDVSAAKSAGLQAMLVDRKNESVTNGTITSLRQLLPAITSTI
jgi:putative hydrolase of the HAD superfamily